MVTSRCGEAVTGKRFRVLFSHGLSWLNFALLVAAVLKFLPLLYSFSYGVDLRHLPTEDPRHLERAWALDLISDTGFLLLVWFLMGHLNLLLVGDRRWRPWRAYSLSSSAKKPAR